jgi:hypothetical protein
MSKFKLFAVFILIFTEIGTLSAQMLQDTLADLYGKYMSLSKETHRLDSLNKTVGSLETQYKNFDAILRSNNESLKRITNAQLFTFDKTLKQQRGKIINTVDFIRSANTSLNAMQVAGSVSSYLENVGQLNNPANNELGFALTDDVVKILDARILNKKGIKTNPTKFVGIVKEIMNAPLTNSFAKAMPVVSNIKGVIDLVINLTATEKNVEVEDLISLKKDMKKYIEHYEGLEQANLAFTSNLNSLNVRVDALKLILKNYSTERLRPINPSVNLDTFRNLTQLVNRYCDKEDVQVKVDRIVEEFKNEKGAINYEKALSDKRLFYPDYALNQSQVIYDELESVSRGFMSNLHTYQQNIEKVLTNSKNNKLGDGGKIDQKTKVLEELLGKVSDAVKNSVNLEDLQLKLQRINGFLLP